MQADIKNALLSLDDCHVMGTKNWIANIPTISMANVEYSVLLLFKTLTMFEDCQEAIVVLVMLDLARLTRLRGVFGGR